MPDWTGSLVTVLAIFAGAGLGYAILVRPRRTELDRRAKAVLVMLSVILLGTIIAPFFWWAGVPAFFPWHLPPLAGRMVASAGWSLALIDAIVLRRPSDRRLRLYLLLLAVYLVPLDVVVYAFHLNRFNFSAANTYTFLVVATGAAAASLWFLWRRPHVEAASTERSPLPSSQEREKAGADADGAPASLPEQLWLGLLASVLGLWGLALFLTDRGPSPLVWVWPGDLLTSRLIAVMLLTLAAGSVAALRYAETARLILLMATTYGLGVVLAGVWNAFAGKPMPLLYLTAFSLVLLGSLLLLVTRTQSAQRARGRPQGA
jgi:hypothetical protein